MTSGVPANGGSENAGVNHAALRQSLDRLKARADALGMGAEATAELEALIDRQAVTLADTAAVSREIAAIRESRTWRIIEQLRRWRLGWQTASVALRHPAGRRRRPTALAALTGRPLGVNVSGYITAESGLGEAVRSTIRALERSGIPVALDNIASQQRTHDTSFSVFATELPHPINLVHLNADNMADFARGKGRRYFRNRYTIGFWFWEMEEFRRDWMPAFRFVDEVWVGSRFGQACLDKVSPVPVTHIPVTIPPLSPEPEARGRFGIPERTTAFLFVFDMSSQYERKNPVAVIRAFREAGFTRDEAILVLKFTNPAFDRAGVRQLHQEASGLHVLFLDGFMSRVELSSLINACDAYVSLHRSEGYGLTILEAMALGKPVIATNYSANVDFMTPANSHPVNYSLVTLDKNSGPYPRSFKWAEPDVNHAARLMRQVAADPAAAAQVGRQAALDVHAAFNGEVVAGKVRSRLSQLRSEAAAR